MTITAVHCITFSRKKITYLTNYWAQVILDSVVVRSDTTHFSIDMIPYKYEPNIISNKAGRFPYLRPFLVT